MLLLLAPRDSQISWCVRREAFDHHKPFSHFIWLDSEMGRVKCSVFTWNCSYTKDDNHNVLGNLVLLWPGKSIQSQKANNVQGFWNDVLRTVSVPFTKLRCILAFCSSVKDLCRGSAKLFCGYTQLNVKILLLAVLCIFVLLECTATSKRVWIPLFVLGPLVSSSQKEFLC